MILEEYSEKNEKSQNVSGEVALDDSALDAVAGGVGDIGVDTKVKTNVDTGGSETTKDITIEDSHRNESSSEKVISVRGDISVEGGISM